MKNTLKIEPYRPILDFIALFAIIASILFLILSATTIPNQIAAHSSQIILTSLGVNSTLTLEKNTPQIHITQGAIEINELCAGIIEISILIALIFATFEKTLRYRIKGATVAIFFLLFFNAIRIALTIAAFGSTWFDFLHELLFRALLVATIIIYYAIWYYWPEKQ